MSCAAALAVVVVATVGWAFDDAPSAGLRGVLTEEPPEGIAYGDWEALDGNWAAWSEETATAVEDLYTSANTGDEAAQRAAIDKLRIKLKTMDTALADRKYRTIHNTLATLRGRLARRVDLAEAILDTMHLDPAQAKGNRVQSAYDKLGAAVAALERDLKSVPAGDAWLPYVRAEQLQKAASSADASGETVEALTRVQRKIDNRDQLADDAQKTFLGRKSFTTLASAIGEVVAAVEWTPPRNFAEGVRNQAAELVQALEEHEATGSDESGAAARRAYNEIKKVAPDGASQLSSLMREHYFSHNLRVTASEGLMKRFVGESRQEQGIVNEPVQEAWLYGTSCTYTSVSVDLKPSGNRARFDLLVNGTVQTNTTANTSQATVYGGSTSWFNATKPVYFDGYEFTTGPVSVGVNSNTYANDVDAKVFFLLRPIADLIAENEVAKRKPQSDAVARQRVSDQVRRNLDRETTDRFANASLELETKTYGPLRELGWYPDSVQTSTSDNELLLRARVMDPDELGGQKPIYTPAVPSNGVTIQVHESLLNNAADRLDIAGKTMTDQELKELLEARISTLLGREFHFTPPQDAELLPPPAGDAAAEEVPVEDDSKSNTYVFDAHDPIRFHIDNGTLTIVLRTGLQRENDTIDTHIIDVPLGFTVAGDQILVRREGNVRVRPAPGVSSNVIKQGIMRQNIQRSIPERSLQGTINVTQQQKTIALIVQSIDANDGWLSITAK